MTVPTTTPAPRPTNGSDTNDQRYRDRHLLEQERTLIERMIARLKQQLAMILPHDPDKSVHDRLTAYNGHDDIDYSTFFAEILNIAEDDSLSSRHRREQRRIMHSIVRGVLSPKPLRATDPLSAPQAFWDHCQQSYAEQSRNQVKMVVKHQP